MEDLVRENVQTYPRPPALEPVPQEIVVVFAGREIVRTRAALRVCETHHAPTYYIPPEAISADLIPAPGRSVCEWKGVAQYWDIGLGARVARRAAWSYPAPRPGFSALAGYLSIYPGQVERCSVGGHPVTPQPGDFYGGWVTDNLNGIVKGGPGTSGW